MEKIVDNYKLINPSNISHIKVFKAQEGVYFYWHGYLRYIWMNAEYFKFLWFIKTPIKNYEEGYYRSGKRKWIANDTPFKIEKDKHFLVGEVVWTKPHIEIYLGKDLIHSEYFSTFTELEKHLIDNYKNVSVEYGE